MFNDLHILLHDYDAKTSQNRRPKMPKQEAIKMAIFDAIFDAIPDLITSKKPEHLPRIHFTMDYGFYTLFGFDQCWIKF